MTSVPLPPAPPADVPPTGTQPPPPLDPPRRGRLQRSGTERMLGGVCGGLADYSGIDAVLWRVGFVGLTLAGGSGLAIYAFLWVLTPAGPLPADSWPSAGERLVERLRRAVTGAVAAFRRD